VSQNSLVDPAEGLSAIVTPLREIVTKHTADWSATARSGLVSILFTAAIPIPPENFPLGCYPADLAALKMASQLTDRQWSLYSDQIISVLVLKNQGTHSVHYQYPPLITLSAHLRRQYEATLAYERRQRREAERKRAQRARNRKEANHAIIL